MGEELRRALGIAIYVLTALFLCYEMGLQVSPSVMTKSLMRDFSLTAKGLGILSGVYFYSYTLMQIPAGMLFDRFSKRLIIPLAIVVCAFGAFFFGRSESVIWAGVGRFAMGIGSAFAFISVLVVAARWFDVKYFAFLVGVAQFLAAVGALCGAWPIAAAVDHWGWRQVIEVLAWVGILLAIICLVVVRPNPDFKRPGNKQFGMGKSLKILLGRRQNYMIAIYAFAMWMPMATFASLWGVPFLSKLYGASNTVAASMIALMWMGIGLVSPFIGWISDVLKNRLMPMRLTAALGVIASLLVIYFPSLPMWLSYVLLFFMGFACSGQILSFAVSKESNDARVTGGAIGLTNMAVVAGGAVFQPLVGVILSNLWQGEKLSGIAIYSVYTYRCALWLVPLCYFIGWVVSQWGICETHPVKRRRHGNSKAC